MATTQILATDQNLNARVLDALRVSGSVTIDGLGGVLGNAQRANAKSAIDRARRILAVRVETVLTLHGIRAEVVR